MTQSSKKKSIFSALYQNRIIVSKENATNLDLPVLVGIILLIVIPWLVVAGSVVALAFGYSFSIKKNTAEFDGSFDSMVKGTVEDVKNAVASM